MPSHENWLQQRPQQAENEVLDSGELLLKPETNEYTTPESQLSNTELMLEEQEIEINQQTTELIKENAYTIKQNSEKEYFDEQQSLDED